MYDNTEPPCNNNNNNNVLMGSDILCRYSQLAKSFKVIVKIVTPCFNRPSLLRRSLVG